ncbi:HAT C-terminal dimerization domain-containing protein [Caenorhabditis elegans]|uniref:HAT C-terminal dimerisation domain-containing protein n=1 Tax=Caenorhabditis elegans TaxID=6239 RepID=Q18809_CAEEL|nr:HAT C-terminal dimerization domain-containing protein [Caenorhabditis elegans]CAA94225.1 HAT C-terminal dimerisation domain-containing protein [Caenorhabditis elegans]|eukprot:NP_501570.1 Uncharacterized protein CELE_C53D6.6 [Caenorhabditis elegans]
MVNLKYDDYFTPLVDGTRLCKILIGSGDNKTVCGHPIKKQKKSSTSGILYHLRANHPDTLLEIGGSLEVQPLKKRKLGEEWRIPENKSGTEGDFINWTAEDFEEKRINDALINMICLDAMPLSTLERPGIQHFLNEVCPTFVPKGKNQMNVMVHSLHFKYEQRLREELRNVEYVGLGCYSWNKDDRKNEQVVGISCHFMNSDGSIVTRFLDAIHISDPHEDPELEIENAIKSITDYYSIGNKVVAMIKDGVSNLKLSAQLLEFDIYDCTWNSLSLASISGINTIPGGTELIEKCKKIVQKINESAVYETSLIGEYMTIDSADLVKSGKLNWITVVSMFEQFTKLKGLLDTFLMNDMEGLMLYQQDYDLMEIILRTLSPLKTAVDFGKQHTFRISAIISLISALISKYSAEHSYDMCKAIKLTLEEELKRYLQIPTLLFATVIDPRVKLLLLPATAKEIVQKKLEKIAQNIRNAEDVKDVAITHNQHCKTDVQSNYDLFAELFKKLHGENYQNSCKEGEIVSPQAMAKTELERWISEPNIAFEEPIVFWQKAENRTRYPLLFQLSSIVLCLPGALLNTENLTSAKNLLFEHQIGCEDQTNQKILFLHQNMKLIGIL